MMMAIEQCRCDGKEEEASIALFPFCICMKRKRFGLVHAQVRERKETSMVEARKKTHA
jgi:hypothetical protein